MLLHGCTGRLHLDLALEKCAVLDCDAGREHISLDLRRGADDDRFGGVQVAVHLAVDHDDAGADIARHRPVRADRQALRMCNGSLDAALDDQVFLCRQFAPKTQGGTQHRRPRRGFGCAHLRCPHFDGPGFGGFGLGGGLRRCPRLGTDNRRLGRAAAARIGIRHLFLSLIRFFEPGHGHATLVAGRAGRAWAASLTVPCAPFLPSMSMRPLNEAPSRMLTLGAKMLPTFLAVSFTNTALSACRSPSTVPSTTMSWARMLALTVP